MSSFCLRKNKTKNFLCQKKRKILKLSIFSGLVASTFVIATIATSCASVSWKSTIQVVVSDSSSVLADQSFSESAYNGLKSFYQDLGISNIPNANSSDVVEGNGIWKRADSSDQSRINTYENVKNDGSKVIIATGFNQQAALQEVTRVGGPNIEKFKDTGFIFVDGAMATSFGGSQSNPTNVASISYRADNGSFLVGLATAVYLNENWDLFYDADARPSTIGASSFVGLAIPPTVSLFNGFRLGLMYWNKIANLITLDDGKAAIPIQWISPTDSFTMDAFASGSFDPNSQAAITITQKLIKKGAKVILPIAGPQTSLVVNAIAQSGENVAVIGVDTPQENISDLKRPMPKPRAGQEDNIIVFSSLKKIEHSVNGVLHAIKDGKEYNGYQGFGYNNIADLGNDGVGISDAGLKYLIDPLFFSSDVTPPNTGETPKTIDISSHSTKYSLKDIKRASNSQEGQKIKTNYTNLLGGKLQIKYSADLTVNWDINGDELSTTHDANNMSIINGNNSTYTIQGAFGGTKTELVATSAPLNGSSWHYSLSRN